jgi:hypothetical protein
MYSLVLTHPKMDDFNLSSIGGPLLRVNADVGGADEPQQGPVPIRRCGNVQTHRGGANVLTRRWGLKKLGSTGPLVPDVETKITVPDQPDGERGSGEVSELWSRRQARRVG